MSGTPQLPSIDEVALSPDQLSEENRALRSEVQTLNRRLARSLSGEDVILRAVQACYSDPPELKIPPRPKIPRRGEREIALLHVTDTQLGKVTESYSISTAERRLGMLADKVTRITEMRRSTARIEECVIFFGGDMVEGELIYPGQAHEIEQSVFDQSCKHAPSILARLVLRMLELFPKVRVYAVCGNHGRPASRSAGSHRRTNWDRVAYTVSRIMLLGSEEHPRKELADRLEYQIADSWYAVTYLFDWGCLLLHGHQIKGWSRFPFYGAATKGMGWIDSIPEPWEYMYFGHHHQHCVITANHRLIFATGSTESSNVFAQETLAASGFPSQRLQFFSPHHGVIADHQILLLEPGERIPLRKKISA